MPRKLDTKGFIERARRVHGDRYDYSLAVYETTKDVVAIKCSLHGVFNQRANVHLNGGHCPACGEITRRESFKRTVYNLEPLPAAERGTSKRQRRNGEYPREYDFATLSFAWSQQNEQHLRNAVASTRMQCRARRICQMD